MRREAGGRRLCSGERGFIESAALFREIGTPFDLAVVRLEHAELLAAVGRLGECEPLLTEARETFEAADTPWLERLDALGVGAATAA